MKVEVDWKGGKAFEAIADSGHKVMMDASPAVGGENRGSRPMELLLMGLGGCSSIDVTMMLEKSRQNVIHCKAVIEAERADAVPAVFTSIHVHFIVTGKDLSEKTRRACGKVIGRKILFRLNNAGKSGRNHARF